MDRVLVVEDSPVEARTIDAILCAGGFETTLAEDGSAALADVERDRPDIVVTDLQMPGIDGLELVETLAARHPALPVVLMTAYGSGEIAMRALQKGAASYLPKRLATTELVETVERVLDLTRGRLERERMLASLVESESRFVLETDPTVISTMVHHVEQLIESRTRELGENERMRLGLALQEALLNAVHHGNLEVDSAVREASSAEYHRLIEERCRTAPYCERHVYLTVGVSKREIVLSVEDEGQGFDVSQVPDPTDPSNLLRASGRGLYLIGTFMDRVAHSPSGKKITMVKNVRAEQGRSAAETDD